MSISKYIEHFTYGIGLVIRRHTDKIENEWYDVEFICADGTKTKTVLACECDEVTERDWADARANPPEPVIC
jgi:hypothetical protein|tara:strand:- start:317 stop:532 length:216 start_codon:yes stop_codon:yes gene_type:complete